MPIKPTLFVVTDIETTLKHRIAFDIAWRTVDRAGRVYDRGSYVIRESFKLDVPYFREKMGHYFDDAFNRLIQPASITEVQQAYNDSITRLKGEGHRVIPCAYNAAFDFKYLPETLQKLTDNPQARWLNQPVELLDIWHYWGLSVPLAYRADLSASGKFYKTSAEAAYRYEFLESDFVERHMAWHDCEIEARILCKTLARKKALPVVKSPRDFVGGVYRLINNRLGVDGKTQLEGVIAA